MNEKLALRGRCARHPPLAVESHVHQTVARFVNSFLSQPDLSMDLFLRSWRSHHMDILRSRCPSRYHPSQYVQVVYSVCLNGLFAEIPDSNKTGLLGRVSSPDTRICLVNCSLLMALYVFYLFGREPVRIDQAAVVDIQAALELVATALAPEPGEFCWQVHDAISWMMRCGTFSLSTRTGPLFACPQCSLPRQQASYRRSQTGLERDLLRSAGYLLRPSCPIPEESPRHKLDESIADHSSPSEPRACTKEGAVLQRREQVLHLRRQRQAEQSARCQRRLQRLLAKVYRSKRVLEDAQEIGGGVSAPCPTNVQAARDTPRSPSMHPTSEVHGLLLDLESQVMQIAQDYRLSLNDTPSVANDSDSSDSEESLNGPLPDLLEETLLHLSHEAGGGLDDMSLPTIDPGEADPSASTDRDLSEATHLLADLERQVHDVLGTVLPAAASRVRPAKRPRRPATSPPRRQPKPVRQDSEGISKKPRTGTGRRPGRSPAGGLEALLCDLERTADHILSEESVRGRE